MTSELQTADKKESTEITTRQNMGFTELMQAARTFAKSSIVPTAYRNKPDDAFVALEWGMELGMKPMASLQNIYVVNGRPTLSAQSMAGLIKSRPDYRGLVFESSPTKAKATIKRAIIDGSIETHTGEFTFEQANKAGLTGKDNWKNYPQQMLEARALAFAVRKAFPDVFAGIYVKEEAQDFDNVRDVTPIGDAAPIVSVANESEAEKMESEPTTADVANQDTTSDFSGVDEAFGPAPDSVLKELMKDITPRGNLKYVRVRYEKELSQKVKDVIDRYLENNKSTDEMFNELYAKAKDYLAKQGIEI